MNTLVLGIGNMLLQDEGIGVHVVQDLEAGYRLAPGVEVLDGGTSGMDLLDMVADRDHLIIVDAVNTGDPAGTLVVLGNEQVPAFFRTKISPHQLGLSDLLAALALMERSPKRLSLVGMVPETMDTGLELSATVAARRADMLARVLAELEANGQGARPLARTGTAG